MITQNRDLRTGETVWKEYATPKIPYSKLSKNIATDVLIIGAGISGAMMAEAVQSQGFDVVVVDKRKPMGGSTAATTALVQFAIDTPLSQLIEKIGREKAIAAWRRSKLAIENLSDKIKSLQIECAFERKDSIYLTGNILNVKEMENECRLRNLIGLQGRMVSSKELRNDYGIRSRCGLFSHNDIGINPLQLTAGFLKGIKIYAPVTVENIEHKKNHILARTGEGFEIKTRFVVFTTGYEIPKYIKTRKHKIDSTWAISTKPVKDLPNDFPHVWEAADRYCYARSMQDGRVVFGGEDEEFSDEKSRDALIPDKTERLLKKLHRMFPDYDFELEHAWTGSFGSSNTGLPSIGQIPHMPNCYAVMAYGGNGITFSRIAADIVSARIAGERDPDEKLFAFK